MPRAKERTIAQHRQNVLGRIYEAFERLIYERGYAVLTLADIAKEADVGRTAMYNYFPDKESLLLSYTLREMDEYFSRLRVELARADDPFDQLDVYVHSQVTYFASRHLPAGPALRSLLPVDVYRTMQHHGVILEETLRAILDEAAQDGLIPAAVVDDPHTVRHIQSCLASPFVTPMRGRELRDLIASTQEFVRRAVGAPGRCSSAA